MTNAANADPRIWPFSASKNTAVRSLERAFRDSLSSSWRHRDRLAELRKSPLLTDAGIDSEMAKYTRGELLPEAARATVALERAKKSVQSRLAQLKPAETDKQDLVAAFRRAEIRDRIRALPAVRREELLTRFADKLEPETIQALLEHSEFPWSDAQEMLITPATRDKLTTALVEASHPEAAAELAELKEAINYVEPTISKAQTEVTSALALKPGEFDQAMKVEAAKEAPVWLKKHGDKTIVIEPSGPDRLVPGMPSSDSFHSRAATEADLLNGEYFADADAWRAACAAAA
ncbi:hypothetical protein [Bradyrhizobium sp. LeoA1S1]